MASGSKHPAVPSSTATNVSRPRRDAKDSPYDLNSTKFDPELYLSRALKEEALLDLIEHEGEMVQQIKTLDTEMQTLVYDNYNKFIVATDTICQMKTDFVHMRDEMQQLNDRVTVMCASSRQMNERLEPSRAAIRQLKCRQDVLKRFQFLFDLPAKLRQFIDAGEYRNAVLTYSKAHVTLEKFHEHAAFAGIVAECKVLMKQIRHKLYEIFHASSSSAKQLAECIDLFNALNEPTENLWNEFLTNAEQRLVEDLKLLESQVQLLQQHKKISSPANQTNETALLDEHADILRFIEFSCNGFLNNIWLVIASYNDMFLTVTDRTTSMKPPKPPSADSSTAALVSASAALDRETARIKLNEFTQKLMSRYFECVSARVELEERITSDRVKLARAMDRLYRRLQAMRKLTDEIDFSRTALNIVKRAAAASCVASLHSLQRSYADLMRKILREQLHAGGSGDVPTDISGGVSGGGGAAVAVMNAVHVMETALPQAIKHELVDLQAFVDADVTFSSIPSFGENFAKNDIVSNLIFQFFRTAAQASLTLVSETAPPPIVMCLVLSRVWLDISDSILKYVLGLRQEMFPVDDDTGLPDVDILQNDLRDTAQILLDLYVRHQGSAVSQMIRKSLETRDWLVATEPRHVRSAMKRVIETVTEIDAQVGQVYGTTNSEAATGAAGAGRRAATVATSDSSHNNHRGVGFGVAIGRGFTKAGKSLFPPRNIGGGGGGAHGGGGLYSGDAGMMSNLNRLFLERVEIPRRANFSRLSISTMVVKMILKTLAEGVRLRTFGKYGLQQLQVDASYLEMYLWRFVDEENILRLMLDDVMSSAVLRCVQPEMMEQNIVEIICEGNVR